MGNSRMSDQKSISFSSLYEETKFLSSARKSTAEATDTFDPSQISSKKGHIFYNAHSYPTKVPVDSIVEALKANTSPGDTVVDMFCGSGMTGLAASLTGRRAIVSDIGTLALHLTANHVTPCDSAKLRTTALEILSTLNAESPYLVRIRGNTKEVNFALYADTVRCVSCRSHVNLWDHASSSGSIPSKIKCPNCKSIFGKTEAELVRKSQVQTSLVGGSSHSTQSRDGLEYIYPSPKEVRLTKSLGDQVFETDREMYHRSALHLQGVTRLRDFYSDRNWFALSKLYVEISKVSDVRIRSALMLAFTNTSWHGSKMRRFNSKGGHRPLTGTLYFPQIYSEANCYRVFENKIETLCRYYDELKKYQLSAKIEIARRSATNLSHIEDRVADFVYTDPPFGSNIFYADCNFLAEAWLFSPTDTNVEAVVNKSLKANKGGKTLEDYSKLMTDSFKEMRRIMKPSASANVVFNSSEGSVWEALRDAFSDAGLETKDAGLLDKVQLSVKGYKAHTKGENTATTDIVIALKKAKRTKPPSKKLKPIDDKVMKLALLEFKDESPGKTQSTPDFFAFLIKFCHLKGYSFQDLSMRSVSNYLNGLDG